MASEMKPPFEFDRYINGVLMAEGVTIERASTLDEAMRAAATIAPNGPNGEKPVLVTRSQTEELLAAKDDHIKWLKRQLEAAQGRAKNAATNAVKFEELLAAERARCAEIAREFSTSAHVAHSIKLSCFPEKSDIRDAIADAIMGNDNAQK